MKYVIRMTSDQHAVLHRHLLPGDGQEAAALVLCGRLQGRDCQGLVVRRIVLIPYTVCVRTESSITWPTQLAVPLINEAARRGMAILKIHSHPGGWDVFSELDNRSDSSFLGSVCSMLDDGLPHASAIMLPDGYIRARMMEVSGTFNPVKSVSSIGDDIHCWKAPGIREVPAFAERTAQVFGQGTVDQLGAMSIAVIGCSGTGSPLIEQLARLGVGRLVLVDPDKVEERNLNRIYMSTASNAREGRLKVEVIAEAIERIGLCNEVVPLANDLVTASVIRDVAGCDLAFGCMDSVYGRDVLNRLATFYTLPYIDLGVRLTAMPKGGVDQVTGAVHYLQPGKSSLKSRRVYDSEDVRAELMRRDDPNEYARQLKQKYIRGVHEERPAVISVNSLVASLAVNEMLARIHRYRYDHNGNYAVQRITLHEPFLHVTAESDFDACRVLVREVGRGDVMPLLDKPELTEES